MRGQQSCFIRKQRGVVAGFGQRGIRNSTRRGSESVSSALRGEKAEDGRSRRGQDELARTIRNLSTGEWRPKDFQLDQTVDIYPVLLSYDYRLDAPLTPYFLAREFARGLGGSAEDEPRVIQIPRATCRAFNHNDTG